MKVYVVMESIMGESDEVREIFLSAEKAQQFIAEADEDSSIWRPEYTIQAFEVIE